MSIAKTPSPPYYAVIFTNQLSGKELESYGQMAEQMETLAQQQPGYFGLESSRDGLGITISYWKSLEAIKNWKANTDHLVAQEKGRTDWYRAYKTRICLVERDYGFEGES